MSVGFAVRNDFMGYRGVNSPEEVMVGEFFSKEEPIFDAKVLTKIEVETLRLSAYAHPVTGSDRYFAEVASLRASGFSDTSTEVKVVKAAGLLRKEEIKMLYPYPTE